MTIDWRPEPLTGQEWVRELATTNPMDILVQPVAAGCWRVVDGAAVVEDPAMLVGFIERTGDGFACTLMASMHECRHASSLDDARAFFEDQCGYPDEVPC
jgi:hypothetical protein